MKKSLLLGAALVVAAGAFAQDLDVYVIGANVNGNTWLLSDPDGKMTYMGNGEYVWEGDVLGTGFKLNDGSWDNPEHNWGSSTELTLDTPIYVEASGSSSDIGFNGFTTVENPKVTFNIQTLELTVSGTKQGTFSWYITGLNDCWDMDEAHELVPVEGEDNVFELKGFMVEECTNENGYYEVRVADTGWTHKYGNTAEDAEINNENLAIELEQVYGEDGKVPTKLEAGEYNIIWDLNEQLLTFVANPDAVEGIAAADENAPVYYYNLQGVRVENPTHGVVIMVRGNQAAKIVK